MAVPVGVWNVVTNLDDAILHITSVAGGNVTGTYQPTTTATYPITGTWDAVTNELKFSYSFPFPIGHFHLRVTLTFTGYAFEAGQPLFNASPGPVSPAVWNMLAGTYQIVSPFGFGTHGWVARSQNQI